MDKINVTKVIMGFILSLCLLCNNTLVYANNLKNQTIFQYNGKELNIKSISYKDRLFVPIRTLSEEFSYKVNWNSQDKTIDICNNNNYYIQFRLNSKFVYRYGQDSFQMDVEPISVVGVTFIPIRYAVELLGKYLEFYQDSSGIKVINITDTNPTQDTGR